MARPQEQISLYGGKADRFREIKNEIEEATGVDDITNPDVLFELMKQWDGIDAD